MERYQHIPPADLPGTPPPGLCVLDTTTGRYWFYSGTIWKPATPPVPAGADAEPLADWLPKS